jgi:hypothetical protein
MLIARSFPEVFGAKDLSAREVRLAAADTRRIASLTRLRCVQRRAQKEERKGGERI